MAVHPTTWLSISATQRCSGSHFASRLSASGTSVSKGGVAGGDALGVDASHVVPDPVFEGADGDVVG